MPRLVVSTCGTSLLTNLAVQDRNLVNSWANVQSPADIPSAEDRLRLEALIKEAHCRLLNADITEQRRLSAELNGLWSYYRGWPKEQDTHWLIATDTWLGQETAKLIGAVLEKAGQTVEVKKIRDMRTDDLEAFKIGMADLARLCAQEVKGLRKGGWKVVFNLTGGFKSVQGFMQALAMLYADESIYIFETGELLKLPRLPIELEALDLVRKHQKLFRRLAAKLPVFARDVRDVPEALLMEADGQVTLSIWGDALWEEAGETLLCEKLWEPIDDCLRFSPNFPKTVEGCSPDELYQVNQRLADLARHLCDPNYHPSRLDFKKLKVPHGRWTHECDAWAKGGAKRLFGYFDGKVFVVDALAEGLH
ncbi:MAG: putative CRISPR-associated protein [Methylohalobius sp.]|nr:putative CRISPR-associated protein [Methylohalobius sp.]